jgi:hypothetical protein
MFKYCITTPKIELALRNVKKELRRYLSGYHDRDDGEDIQAVDLFERSTHSDAKELIREIFSEFLILPNHSPCRLTPVVFDDDTVYLISSVFYCMKDNKPTRGQPFKVNHSYIVLDIRDEERRWWTISPDDIDKFIQTQNDDGIHRPRVESDCYELISKEYCFG